MLTVSPLRDDAKAEFERLFSDYYTELECDEDVPHLLAEYVIPDLLAGLLHIDILKDGQTYVGFVIYQKDDIDNEWNKKEGWGDIREIYVSPAHRLNGLGKFLLFTAEMKLKESGIERCYAMPCEGAQKFFEKCGYTRGREYDEELDCFVYEKLRLNKNCGK